MTQNKIDQQHIESMLHRQNNLFAEFEELNLSDDEVTDDADMPVAAGVTRDMPNNLISGTILLLGDTGSGKSTLAADLTGLECGVGHGIDSQTQDIVKYEAQCKRFSVIDTPGLNDSRNLDDVFLNKLYEYLKRVKFDYVCILTDKHRRLDQNTFENINLYLEMIGVQKQKVTMVFTSPLTKQKQLEVCNKFNNFNLHPVSYVKNEDTIVKVLDVIASCKDHFDRDKVKLVKTTKAIKNELKLESKEMQKALKLIQEQNAKLQDQMKTANAEHLKELKELREKKRQQEIVIQNNLQATQSMFQSVASSNRCHVDSGRCQATTQRGTQCKRRGTGGGYCWQH
jgi:Fe2+ transport system protein B